MSYVSSCAAATKWDFNIVYNKDKQEPTLVLSPDVLFLVQPLYTFGLQQKYVGMPTSCFLFFMHSADIDIESSWAKIEKYIHSFAADF